MLRPLAKIIWVELVERASLHLRSNKTFEHHAIEE